MSTSTAELLKSSAGKIISNLGMVLSHTKDALLKDLLGDMPSYLPEIAKADNYTYVAFKATLKSGETPIGKFIESLFTRLGYDISSFQQSKEMFDSVRAVLAAVISISEGMKDLLEGQDWMSEAKKFMERPGSGFDNIENIQNLFNDSTLNNIGGGSSGVNNFLSNLNLGDDKISAILKLIIDLISLIKKFRDLEWKKMLSENKDFAIFINENYFNKKFAERLFDHILAVLLSNAKEIFAEDIDAIVDNIDLVRGRIENEVKDDVKAKINEIITKIKSLRTEIKAIKSQIEAAKNGAGAGGQNVAGEVSLELQTRLTVAKADMEKLVGKILSNYNSIGRVFSQIYAVLDFLKIIDKETIAVAKYLPQGAPPVPGLTDRTVDIYVIKWTKLEEIFTKPADYFKSLFPLKDFDDAEKLLKRIQELVKAFNVDIPDFSSIQKLLYELLARLKNKINDNLNPIGDDVKTKFAQLENYIIDLLKVFEKFAIGLKQQLTTAYNNIDAPDSLVGKLKGEINKAIEPCKASNSIKDFTIPNTNIQFTKLNGVALAGVKSSLEKSFADSFIRIAYEKGKEHELFRNIKFDEWEKAIKVDFDKNLIKQYKPVLDRMEKDITDLFGQNAWETKFREILTALKNEFAAQTAKIPTNFDGVKNFCKDQVSLDKLKNGLDIGNPFSDFDFTKYITIVSDKIKAMVPCNPDTYFTDFSDITITSLKGILVTASYSSVPEIKTLRNNISNTGATDFEARVADFAKDVFLAYWNELKSSLHKTLARPFTSLLERSVKTWAKTELIPAIIEYVVPNISNELNFGLYKGVFDEVATIKDGVESVCEKGLQTVNDTKAWAKEAGDMVKNILLLAEDAKNLDVGSWSDGLQFALKLYRAIPPTVKNYLRELIGLPDWNFEGLALPDYKLDINNKFFAVTVYEYTSKDKVQSNDFNADVSIKLVAFVGDRKIKDTALVESGLYLLPVIRGNFNILGFNLGESHVLQLNANSTINENVNVSSGNNSTTEKSFNNDALGFFFTLKNGSVAANLLGNASAITAYLELLFKRGQKGSTTVPPLEIYKGDIAELTLGNYPQKLFIGYNNGLDFGYKGGLEDLQLKLNLRKLNGFFEVILKEDLQVKVEKLMISYGYKDGFKFDGAYRVRIPLKPTIDLSVLKFTNLNLEIGSGDLKNIELNLITDFTVDFKGLIFSFSEMGFGLDINYMKPSGGFGDFNVKPEFRFPTGVAISINLEAVKGTGIIKWDTKKGEFLGALELSIVSMLSAGALVIFSTKMPDGSKGFSFMGAISVFFTPGIQLSMGFSLTGIGGSLGVNRRIDMNKMTASVRDGSLESMLFVRDLAKNLDCVLANISSFYPVQKDQFFFGFLAQITWVEILKIEFGLFIQAPSPVVIMIAGGMHLNLVNLLKINVIFAGGIDFSKGLFFDAELVDSSIVGITLSGSMALRIYWAGDTRGFILSAGGFHPQFKPEAGFNVGDLKRLAMKLDYKILKISLESYFAVTSNTVQFGAALLLKIGWDSVGITGELAFNVLFQFKPFYFIADISAKVAAKLGKITLLSISLSFELSGPGQWNAKGQAEFKILFIKCKVNFNKSWTTGGKKNEIEQRQIVILLPQFTDNFLDIDNRNWKITSGDIVDGLVEIIKFDEKELVMQPSDRISFSQDFLPLDREMVRYGEAIPGDVMKIELKELSINDEKTTEWKQTTSHFAPTLINKLDDNNKLKAPSFEKMNAGFVLTASHGEQKGAYGTYGEEYANEHEENWDRWKAYLAWLKTQSQTGGTQGPSQPPLFLQMPNIYLQFGITTIASPVQLTPIIVGGINTGSFFTTGSITYMQTAGLMQLSARLRKFTPAKPSLRKTDTGFMRHTLAAEAKLGRKVDGLIEQLDCKIIKK